MKNYYPVILFLALVFSLWTAPSLLMAQDSSQGFIKPPDTFEGVKTMVLKLLGGFPSGFEVALNYAKTFWNDMVIWIRGWWSHNLADRVKVWLNNTWQKLKSLFLERKDIFEKELNGEKKEMGEDVKKEIPELKQTFLEKIKEIIK